MLKRSIGIASGFVVAMACSANSPPDRSITALDGTGGSGAGDSTGAAATAGAAGARTPWMTSNDPNGAPSSGIIGSAPFREVDAASMTKCVGVANQGKQVTVDIFIMFDQSESMSCALPAPSDGTAGAAGAAGSAGAGGATTGAGGATTGAGGAATGAAGAAATGGDRWGAVKTALQDFLMAPAATGLNVGIQYFGLGSSGFLGALQASCNFMDYQTADVEIGELPGNAQKIITSLNAHMPSTNTPTTPALTGAINHAIDWKNAHPGHAVIVLLITDGQPNGCGAVADVVQVAQAGLKNTIPTYVIGVTSPGTTCMYDQNPPNQQDLDAVAMAGGTGQALIVDLSKDTVKQFLDTMDKIRAKSTVPCQYAVPPPPMGEKLDPNKVNVEYTPPGATTPTTLNYVAANTCDPATGGWFYDDPLMPKTITLCPASCDQIKKDVSGAVNIALGCARKITQ